MTAAAITETSFNILGEGTVAVYAYVTETGDWIVLDSAYPGTLGVVGTQFPTDAASAAIVPNFAKLIAKGATASTTTESFEYDGATASQRTAGAFYILNNATGEIMYVVSDSGYTTTTGTLVVKRGALGTTAAAVTDNDEFAVLNCIEITSAIGWALLEFRPLPSDYNVKMFSA